MGQMTRYCRECGQHQLFDQPHAAGCPDAPDGACAEWACTRCGGALLCGLPPGTGFLVAAGPLGPPGLTGQVA